MDASTQEDSLVFASQSKRSGQSWQWSDPQNHPEILADATLVDNEENTSEKDGSFLFSAPFDSQSPRIGKLYDTDESLRSFRDSRRGYDTLGDTQMISRDTRRSENGAETSFVGSNVENSPFQDTQVIPSRGNELADTQVIGHDCENPSFVLRDNDRSFTGDTQVLGKNVDFTDDTQVIHKSPSDSAANSGATQIDASWTNASPDTQVIIRNSGPHKRGFIYDSSVKRTPNLNASPFLEYEQTQQDSDQAGLLIDSSPTKTMGTFGDLGATFSRDTRPVLNGSGLSDIEGENTGSKNSEHNKITEITKNIDNENIDHENIDHENIDHENIDHENIDHENIDHENTDNIDNSQEYTRDVSESSSAESPQMGSVTFDVSSEDDIRMEPTTQVPNTQEEYIDSGSPKPVDLGSRPVFSSSQNEDNRAQSRIGVESDDEVVSSLNDDVFRRSKRRKIALSSSSQSNGVHTRPSDGKGVAVVSKSGNSGVSNPDIGSSLPAGVSESDESSELDDFSHDVTGLDLAAMGESYKKKNDEIPTKFGELAVSTKISKYSGIPDPQTWRESAPSVSPSEIIKNTGSVWALHQFKRLSAKVVEYGESFSKVQLQEGLQIEAKNTDLSLLDICVGDIVQLKSVHGDYVVVGLTFYTVESQVRCIRGYDTAILAKKSKSAAPKEYLVSLEDICMELDQWVTHLSRFHILLGTVDLLQENYGVVQQMLESKNPVISSNFEKTTENQQISPRKAAKEKADLFAGMLFFITSIKGPRKDQLKETIVSYGGVVVDDELKNTTVRETSFFGKLVLSSKNLASFKFGALLADGYSRSAKYLQALTLGWPILADCYIDKVIENRDFRDKWPVFLLPAGHSTHTKTLTNLEVFEFRSRLETGRALNEQLQNNSGLLKGYTMVLYNRKQDSKMVDICDFVFHAFGASAIEKFKDASGIDTFVKKMGGASVLVYDNAQGDYVQSHGVSGGKKRGRSPVKRKIGVVDWEWVVQCVISKYIWEPERYVEL